MSFISVRHSDRTLTRCHVLQVAHLESELESRGTELAADMSEQVIQRDAELAAEICSELAAKDIQLAALHDQLAALHESLHRVQEENQELCSKYNNKMEDETQREVIQSGVQPQSDGSHTHSQV